MHDSLREIWTTRGDELSQVEFRPALSSAPPGCRLTDDTRVHESTYAVDLDDHLVAVREQYRGLSEDSHTVRRPGRDYVTRL